MYERGFWFFQNGFNPKAVNSFGAMVPYMGPIFVIRYAMRRRKTFHLIKSHDLSYGTPRAKSSETPWTMAAEKAPRRDRHCIASNQF